MPTTICRILVPSCFMLCTYTALAQETAQGLNACAGLSVDHERLQCYDRLAGRSDPVGQERVGAANAQASPGRVETSDLASARDREPSMLSGHWELAPAHKRGVFNFRPHHENYLVATYNRSPNDSPYRPFRGLTPEADGLSDAELAFQLGFKLKLLENLANRPIDLWFGYTQRSFWQASNEEASSPFRETNYQPELMAVVPVNLNLAGLQLRFVNLGIAHQSNGQVSALSRSWNRTYLQAGFERGNFTLLARIWKRFNESADKDDNPDIVDYMGRGDIIAKYRWNGHEFSALTRYNTHTDKGAAQLGWAFPLVSNLKGYVHYFTGYGYSLIDYNASQRVLGLGLQVDF